MRDTLELVPLTLSCFDYQVSPPSIDSNTAVISTTTNGSEGDLDHVRVGVVAA